MRQDLLHTCQVVFGNRWMQPLPFETFQGGQQRIQGCHGRAIHRHNLSTISLSFTTLPSHLMLNLPPELRVTEQRLDMPPKHIQQSFEHSKACRQGHIFRQFDAFFLAFHACRPPMPQSTLAPIDCRYLRESQDRHQHRNHLTGQAVPECPQVHHGSTGHSRRAHLDSAPESQSLRIAIQETRKKTLAASSST